MIKIMLQVLCDNMNCANSNDTFRLYMENDQPGGEIFEERYDKNDNLVERSRH
jgi:hypothetical protein